MFILCSECFLNEGLKIEAQILGCQTDSPCPNCCSVTGYKLTSENIELLIEVFFQKGSIQYDACVFEPILKVLATRGTRDDFDFGEQLNRDFKLICSVTDVSLIFNAPRTYRIGQTKIADEVQEANRSGRLNRRLRKHFDKIIDACQKITLQPGQKIYRIRKGEFDVKDNKQYDTPPKEIPPKMRQEFRMNDKFTPIFYAAYDIETCIHEVKPDINDVMILVTYLIRKELRIVDLQNVDINSPFEWEGSEGNITYFLANLFNSRDYSISQLLSKRIREREFDGVNFNSYFSKVRDGFYTNLALYDFPLNDAKIGIHSINRILIESVKYQSILGPAVY